MGATESKTQTAIFFCRQIDENQDTNRRIIEKEFGPAVRFFPLPCSGRIEPLHLLRAIESGADAVYLVTCPESTCRYTEGNERAGKRLKYVQGLLQEIGIDPNRLELIRSASVQGKTIDAIARELLQKGED